MDTNDLTENGAKPHISNLICDILLSIRVFLIIVRMSLFPASWCSSPQEHIFMISTVNMKMEKLRLS